MSLPILSAFGVELEYMIVDSESLSIRPIADELIRKQCGAYESHVDRGDLAWSNELALHVVELKTNGPVPSLEGLPEKFQLEADMINGSLKDLGARLMPTAMHPWMDPLRETRLWPHDYNPVYEAFNKVFDCRGHGWSNLQSCHLNLPFATDEEFARLHAAIRLVLPILPALAASSPLQDGRVTGCLDNRLNAYRSNCAKIPSVTGRVIPEPVFSAGEYQERILQRIYRDIAPFDPEGTLQDEWVNARGAIARFERNTIEIRMLDVQECPMADLAIAAAMEGLVRGLVEEQWSSLERQKALSMEELETVFLGTMRDAEKAIVRNPEYLRALGIASDEITAGGLWNGIVARRLAAGNETTWWLEPLEVILSQGPLARRILRSAGSEPSREKLREVYEELCACLGEGRMFQ